MPLPRGLRPLPVLLLFGWLLHLGGGVPREAASEPDASRALVNALASEGLIADPAEVNWLDPPPSFMGSRWTRPRAVVRAARRDEPADVYLVSAKLSPEGRLLELGAIHNLSETSAVDEQRLTVSGARVGWLIGGGGKIYSFHLADLRGAEPPTGPGWTRLARFQNSVTNLQETGEARGIVRRSFKLDPAADRLALGFTKDQIIVDADGRQIRVPTETAGPVVGERFVREQPHEKARPGNLVTWAVDRVRGLPWFGSDRMQAVKAVAFVALDWIERASHNVSGDDGAESVAVELEGLPDTPSVTYTDPETGWPPPPMEPMLSRPLEGEGKWVLLDRDPFILKNPGAPAPFAFSFIRVDPKRSYAQTFVTIWDPRQVRLSAMSGTVEPKSATGETGPGLVPRKPEVMGRLVGGFNGGFQATHGEFGMMSEGVVYLPPKPYAATVAELADGSTAFGTWPRNDSVPDGFLSFRQNMTPLVMDDVLNPYKRYWWGGVPPGWTDEARTVRSAVCLTKENFVAYMYGSSMDADHLMIAMQRARCVYGIHLDMNPGHTGLEFYRAAPAGQLPDLGRELDDKWEAKGAVSGMQGWEFIGRRMIKYMGLMNFPRYIQREARDFFYLTLRHVLPGPSAPTAVEPREAGEGEWVVKGLPQHGWPYAVARTWVRPDAARVETKVQLLEIDPHAVRPAKAGEDARVVLSLRAGPARPESSGLYLTGGAFSVTGTPPAGAERLASGALPGGSRSDVAAAVGIRQESGMLVYAEVVTAARPGQDGEMLDALLERLGCKTRLLLARPLEFALGGERDLSGHPVPRNKADLRLVRGEVPGARRIFPDTPIVPPKEWHALQSKRVRYFRKAEPAASGGAAPAGAPAQPTLASDNPPTQ
jgi:hypothetical protein